MKRVLMVAYHFPPLAGSSGIQRTLRFVQHLPAFEWQPLVLSADPRAYERVSEDLARDIPTNTPVYRAFALDTARHLALRGRYVGAMARPDRWVSWRFDAVRVGMQMIRRYKPDVLWSTYPIATAHLIGSELSRRSGIPWIADFRDPMAQDGYPADPRTWAAYQHIEEDALNRAAASTFTTPGAARVYQDRYPAGAARVRVLENGYDEESFVAAQSGAAARDALRPGAFTLLHSGIIYSQERDPTQLMAALQRLAAAGVIVPGRFYLRFRAAVQDTLLLELAQRHGVAGFIEVLPPVGYQEALREMMAADALLVMQASDCNEQIPAKVYEYLRAGRPIACLSDPRGDTIALLRAAGLDLFARLDDAADIAAALQRMLARGEDGASHSLPRPDFVHGASRKRRTAELAQLLDATLAA